MAALQTTVPPAENQPSLAVLSSDAGPAKSTEYLKPGKAVNSVTANSLQAKPGGPVYITSGTVAAMALSQPTPVYPPIAKAAHVQGAVILHAIISKQGTIQSLEVVTGPPLLTETAIDAVKLWTYKPYLFNGKPTEVETTINVNFTFGGPDTAAVPAAPVPMPAQSH